MSIDERRPEGHVDPVHGVAPVEETSADGGRARRPGELGPRELLRWTWRQVTSMRTALVLLLLLALAAVPGSVIPQSGVDALKVTQWKADHPQLTPIYERLGLFSVYDSAWFSAIYLLLMISLVGCILPRSWVYLRALRGTPPAAPRNLTRLPDHTTYTTDEDAQVVLEHARAVLRRRHYRLRPAGEGTDGLAVSAERGYLREAGNLLFHVSVLVVLAGFAIGGLFGYQGGVIILKGSTFANVLPDYDDFDPGSLFGAGDLNPFSFTVDDFNADWLRSGPGKGTARAFSSDVTYREGVDGPAQSYDLRVNHPLDIDGTDVFLIGHGYAPRITIRDGAGEVVSSAPRVFLPQDQSFLSFGVVKPRSADPDEIGLEGNFYPTYVFDRGNPTTVSGEDLNPTLSMFAYTGDMGIGDGTSQSVYILDKDDATQLKNPDGTPLRIDLQPGDTQVLPDGLGSVTFDGVEPWVRVQISQTPGKGIALVGVVLALVGLLGSLFIRPRRVWVRVRRRDDADGGGDAPGAQGGGATMVEVAALDRSGGGDVAGVLAAVVADLRGQPAPARRGAERHDRHDRHDGDDGETSR